MSDPKLSPTPRRSLSDEAQDLCLEMIRTTPTRGQHVAAMRWLDGFMQRQSLPSETKECIWTADEDGVYSTGCGHNFFFDTGTAKENSAAFCQYCGDALKAVEITEEPSDG